MYERMLNRQEKPTPADMTAFCGGTGQWFARINEWLSQTYGTEQHITFPYGNKYGWGIAHRRKQKLLCNIFAERGGFTIMVRLSDAQFQSVYESLQTYARQYIDNRYPCGDGGWIHYRVTCEAQIGDIQTILAVRCSQAGGKAAKATGGSNDKETGDIENANTINSD